MRVRVRESEREREREREREGERGDLSAHHSITSCWADPLCFWLAAQSNQQVQGNLVIPGPDLWAPGLRSDRWLGCAVEP